MWILLFISISVYVCGHEEMMSVLVSEEDSVTLHTDLTEKKAGDQILWRFGSERSRIADLTKLNQIVFDNNERFNGKLEVNRQTGSLTIRNITREQSGPYLLTIICNNRSSNRWFRVTVVARLAVPVISRNSSHSSSSSVCVLVCSVENVSDVTLSWYKGESFFSSISVSDLSRRVSLPLEIESLSDSYICVLNNTITHQNTHLNVSQLRHICSDETSVLEHCCSYTEAVIRLVVSAVVGVAMVAVMVYDIRSSRVISKRSSLS